MDNDNKLLRDKMFIGDTRGYIGDFLGLGKASKKHKNRKPVLDEIIEESENFTETVLTLSDHNNFELPNFSDEKKTNKKNDEMQAVCSEYILFLEELKNHPGVYKYFINEAVSMRLLTNYMKLRGKSLFNIFNDRMSFKRNSVTPTKLKDEIQDDESYLSDTIDPPRSIRKGFSQQHHYFKSKKITISLKDSDESSSQASSISSYNTGRRRFMSFKNKKIGLHSGNSKLREIFDQITKNKPKMHAEDFKGYLNKRYSHTISDTIFNMFNFRLGSFDDYINELNKLINASEVRHLEFSFSIFDFNRDKHICFKDAFTALEQRTGSFYDNDLRLIVETFDLKREGKLYSKLRRKSTLSLINDKKKKKNIFKFLKQDMNDKEKNVFLNFKEFCMIKFLGRPQIFVDFIDYATGYNFLKEKGLLKQIPTASSRESEHIIAQMRSNDEFYKLISRKEKFDYYIKLDSSLSLFTNSQKENLLKKFNYLKFDEKLKYKVITKASMIEKLPDLLGFNNPYFSERVYEYFSQGKDLTKPVFLNKVYDITIEQKEAVASKLAFDLYDSRKDEFLTVDEAYHMFETLPISSQAYHECFKIISLFILSIFERLRSKLEGINFSKFLELIPVSVIGLEIIEFLTLPFEECIGRKSGIFKTSLIDENTISMHYSTRSSLLKLLD